MGKRKELPCPQCGVPVYVGNILGARVKECNICGYKYIPKENKIQGIFPIEKNKKK